MQSSQCLNAPSIVVCADSFNLITTILTGLFSREEQHRLALDQVRMSLEMVKYH